MDNSLEKRIQWWLQAKYGMFIHWGLWSVHGIGYGLLSNLDFRRERKSEYFALKDFFLPKEGIAEDWIRLAKKAGMNYAVLTTKHADGFALFNTQVNDFNSMKSPCQRDIVKEFTEACRKYDIKVGFYYAVSDETYDAFYDGPDNNPDGWRKFKEATFTQVIELMKNYGKIDILWYDGCPHNADVINQLNKEVRKLQPGILINNRGADGKTGDFATPEKAIIAGDRDWEACDTLPFTWGHSPWDHHLKSPLNVMEELVQCAWKGGNYLLNISPDRDGAVPSDQAKVLEEVGKWLEVNSESVFGTNSPGSRGFTNGFVTMNDKEKKFYLHVMPYYWYNKLFLNSYKINVKRAYYLCNGEDLTFRKLNGSYAFTELPEVPPDPLNTVIVLEYEGAVEPISCDHSFVPPLNFYNNKIDLG